MKKIWLFLPILLLNSRPASATDSNLKEQLRKTYVGSQQMLRHFYVSTDLKFDVDGNPRNKEKEGPWTLLSGVSIDHVTLKSDKLEISGYRRLLVLDEHTKTLRSIKLGERFSVEVASQPGPQQAGQLSSALARVFVSADDLVSVVPDYWRDYLARFSGKSTQGAPCEDSAVKIDGSDNSSNGEVSAGIIDGEKTHNVLPTYLGIARVNRVEGELALRAVTGSKANWPFEQ